MITDPASSHIIVFSETTSKINSPSGMPTYWRS